MFDLKQFVSMALQEDVGAGDYSTLACIDANLNGEATFIYKDTGVVAGIELMKQIIPLVDDDLEVDFNIEEGTYIDQHTILGHIHGSVHSILKGERLWLNIMQRMSGIASLTQEYVQLLSGSNTKILDTRKTTPLFRYFEKEAVRIGGGMNHRFGLYDMIMLKDNHIDFCGGIKKALDKTYAYLEKHQLDLKVEIECGSIEEVQEVIEYGKVDRVMLDNFNPAEIVKALTIINGQVETEASGGINLSNLKEYASTGVDFISSGAIIHQAVSKDISLKASF